MKTFSICTAIAVLAAAFAHAAPTYVTLEQRNSPPFLVQVTFQGAPPQTAFYTKQIPGDGSLVYLGTSICSIRNPLYFSFVFHSHQPSQFFPSG